MVRMSTSYPVGQVAHLAGVTVRTLHHYDESGLLAPTDRTSSGCRRYGVSDLERLQAMAAAIEKELEAKQMGISLSPGEQFEVFGTDKVGGEWADEAEQRWGKTRWGDNSACKQSQRRTAKYTKQDWVKLKAEADEGLRAFADAMRAGTAAVQQALRGRAPGPRPVRARRDRGERSSLIRLRPRRAPRRMPARRSRRQLQSERRRAAPGCAPCPSARPGRRTR